MGRFDTFLTQHTFKCFRDSCPGLIEACATSQPIRLTLTE